MAKAIRVAPEMNPLRQFQKRFEMELAEVTLSVGNFGPSITIKNGARTNQREGAETYSVTAPVDKNDELVGL